MSDLEKSYVNSFVIAATNRKDLLDEALISTGRFGLHMEIPMPDESALSSIYDIHSKNQPLDESVSKPQIVSQMLENKFNGSDVAEMFTVGFFNALERLDMNKKIDANYTSILLFISESSPADIISPSKTSITLSASLATSIS